MLSARKKLDELYEFFAQCFSGPENTGDVFSFNQLPSDIQKLILAMFLHDTFYADPKSFINLALTCKILNELATDVFSQSIAAKDMLASWAIVNEEDGYLPYGKSQSPRSHRRALSAIDPKFIESALITQINNHETDFFFKTKRSYRLYSKHTEALDEQKRCESESWRFIGKKKSIYLENKPAVYQVYCSKQISENNKNVNPHQLFFVRADYAMARNKVNTLSLENCLPLKAQRQHDDIELEKNRDNNDQARRDYDNRFGLVLKK